VREGSIMRMLALIMMSCASLACTSLWFITTALCRPRLVVHRSSARRDFRRLSGRRGGGAAHGAVCRWGLGPRDCPGLCEHCQMNEANDLSTLCVYCSWTLPGLRLRQYVREEELAVRRTGV
jgi:hypothetical protein